MTQPTEPRDNALILIVDDSEIERLMAKQALEKAGFRTIEATNGREGLTAFSQYRPELVLLDLVMPELDGFAVCAQLRQLPDGAEVPVIMNTSLEDLHSIEKAYETGVNDFITKPINPTLLVYRVRHTLRTRRDMLELRRAEKRIQQLAYYDEVTSLPNRSYLKENLQHTLARARRNKQLIAIYFLDLDQFKLVNDTLGHSAGDALLQQVARRLLTCVRSHDAVIRPSSLQPSILNDTVIRLGGDEFVIVASDIQHSNDAANLAQRIIDILTPAFTVDGNEVFVTTSIGISLYPDNGEDLDVLLRNADAAMYHAKEQGRNGYRFFSNELNARIRDRLILKNELMKAIEQDELTLHYQPRLELPAQRITGVEALVRWQHPQRGMVAPNEFIPLAEETGLIIPLGEWVLKNACEQLVRWKKSGLSLDYVSVNFSVAQFNQKDVHQRIADILASVQLPPECLELEVTESLLIEPEKSSEYLNNLKKLGVHISIDDFGTGYSSLAYLKRLPIDALKIDRSFTQDIDTDSDGAAIVAAIIALAHSLHLKVVAEGVEQKNQLEFLCAHGCDEGQGYLFSRPLTVEALAKVFAEATTVKRQRLDC